MNKNANPTTTLTIDLKKYRIRIFKQALHLMGDPKYIQFLVNPARMEVALLAVDKQLPRDQTHKVNMHTLLSENSIEIYSMSFINKLCEVVGGLESNLNYRLSGEVLVDKRAAIFSLKTIRRTGAMESHDET